MGEKTDTWQGTLALTLLKTMEGLVSPEWGVSDNNRGARYYRLTGPGRKRLAAETRERERTAAILARFFAPAEEA